MGQSTAHGCLHELADIPTVIAIRPDRDAQNVTCEKKPRYKITRAAVGRPAGRQRGSGPAQLCHALFRDACAATATAAVAAAVGDSAAATRRPTHAAAAAAGRQRAVGASRRPPCRRRPPDLPAVAAGGRGAARSRSRRQGCGAGRGNGRWGYPATRAGRGGIRGASFPRFLFSFGWLASRWLTFFGAATRSAGVPSCPPPPPRSPPTLFPASFPQRRRRRRTVAAVRGRGVFGALLRPPLPSPTAVPCA